MAIRLERRAATLGLGDAVIVAQTIEKKKSSLRKEFREQQIKGVVSQKGIQAKKDKDAARIKHAQDKAYNPRIRRLDGIEGLQTAPDGTIGLAELRAQKPEVFKMKPMPKEGKPLSRRMMELNEIMTNHGRRDRYGHFL